MDGVGSSPAVISLTLLAEDMAPPMERSCGSLSMISLAVVSRERTEAVSQVAAAGLALPDRCTCKTTRSKVAGSALKAIGVGGDSALLFAFLAFQN